ncbi:hypothetical protein L3Q82_015265, partial [Scortum barcoo]
MRWDLQPIQVAQVVQLLQDGTFHTCCHKKHDQFGGGSVIFWGGKPLEGHTDLHVLSNGTLTAVRYQGEILRATVRPYTGAVDPVFLVVQDNARPHVARVCRQFLDDE